jgi:hypothetical protein
VLVDGETEVPVLMHFDEQGRPPPVEFILSVVRDVRHRLETYREAAADQLLDIFNSGWAKFDAEGPVSRQRFISRLSLQQIEFDYGMLDAKGTLGWLGSVQFDADEMFTEHSVSVCRIWGKPGLRAGLN